MLRWISLVPLAACGRLGFGELAAGDAADAALTQDASTVATEWVATTPLPAPRRLGCTVMARGHAYSIGGGELTAASPAAFSAPVLSDGALGPWSAEPDVPDPAPSWHACAVDPTSSTVYVIGGTSGDLAHTVVRRATIQTDGHLSPWTLERPLPGPRRGAGAVVIAGVVYVLGGESAEGFNLHSTVFAASIGANGALDPWVTTTPLPTPNYVFGTATANNIVYMTGGYADHEQVFRAAVGGGFIGSTSLPTPHERHASTYLDGYVYTIGGEEQFDGESLADVLRAPINADGSLGAWTALSDLPRGLSYLDAASYGGRLYVFGGGTRIGGSVVPSADVFVRVP